MIHCIWIAPSKPNPWVQCSPASFHMTSFTRLEISMPVAICRQNSLQTSCLSSSNSEQYKLSASYHPPAQDQLPLLTRSAAGKRHEIAGIWSTCMHQPHGHVSVTTAYQSPDILTKVLILDCLVAPDNHCQSAPSLAQAQLCWSAVLVCLAKGGSALVFAFKLYGIGSSSARIFCNRIKENLNLKDQACNVNITS